MEQNLPVITKKVWNLLRVMFFMLKKGISKAKLFADLNMMIKRGKIAGKSLHNLLFHHRHLPFPSPPSGEYEFSCSNTPPYPISLFSAHKNNQNKHHRRDTPLDQNNDILVNATVMKALENILTASPGYGKSPVVKQLRITDSPFPLSNGDGDGQVDEAADKFIMRFYNDLRRQN